MKKIYKFIIKPIKGMKWRVSLLLSSIDSRNVSSKPDLLDAYSSVDKFVQRTGGSNADGRISKSFFG